MVTGGVASSWEGGACSSVIFALVGGFWVGSLSYREKSSRRGNPTGTDFVVSDWDLSLSVCYDRLRKPRQSFRLPRRACMDTLHLC